MGESKRRAEILRQAHDEFVKRLGSEGKVIEGGWLALKAMWLPKDASAQQERDLRYAFMAGAQHLFASIMTILDPGEEPTEADLRRMDLLAAELEVFRIEVEMALPTEGRA